MGYSLNGASDNCYENTSVLINKLNIREQATLHMIEESVSYVQILKAFDDIPFKNVDFEFYKRLHGFVFGDIYDWAGTVRTINISKKGTVFCDVKNIDSVAERLFKRLKEMDYLKGLENEEFISEFCDLYCSLNHLHPFREGNGRIERLFLSMLAIYTGRAIDFAQLDKDLLMIATIKAAHGDIFLLQNIFRELFL